MHELSLAEAVVSALLKMCEEEKWGAVKKVCLRVGALRQVFPDMLEFAFGTLVKDTPLSDAALVIEDVPLTQRCGECGVPWPEECVECPSCGSLRRETVTGMELEIHSVEVEAL